jgi:hypothetical protein
MLHLGGAHTAGVRRRHQARQAALVTHTDQDFRCCLADNGLVAGSYETLAADYDWLFDDHAFANGVAGPWWPSVRVRP